MSHTGHMSHRLIMMLLSGALNALQIDHGGGGGGGGGPDAGRLLHG